MLTHDSVRQIFGKQHVFKYFVGKRSVPVFSDFKMIQTTLEEISSFLTEEVLDTAFKLKTNSQDSVKSIQVTRAAPAGEGLLSAVFRIHVTGHNHSTNFIVKGLPKDPVLLKTLGCPKFFAREAMFFSKILPVLIEYQIVSGAKERIQNSVAYCYACHQDGINDFILLEDLSEKNCYSINGSPTDEECNAVLKTLAHFHAISMALRIKRPEEFNRLASSVPEVYLSEENRDWYSKYLGNAVDIDRAIMDELEDPNSVYYKKFNEMLSEDLYGQYVSSVSQWGDHPVLCHGDAWSPNFLLSKETAVAIDFQIVRCASPATDLTYWIFLNSNHNTTTQDFVKAVDVYYAALEYFLKDLQLDASKVFCRKTLDSELKQNGKYGYLASLTSIPLLATERCDVLKSVQEQFPGVDNIPLEVLWQLTPINDEKTKTRLVNVVRMAVDVGLI